MQNFTLQTSVTNKLTSCDFVARRKRPDRRAYFSVLSWPTYRVDNEEVLVKRFCGVLQSLCSHIFPPYTECLPLSEQSKSSDLKMAKKNNFILIFSMYNIKSKFICDMKMLTNTKYHSKLIFSMYNLKWKFSCDVKILTTYSITGNVR